MRFGSFVFPVSHQPENDSAVIDSTLDEIVLAEKIGMHSVWLTEHHFDGAAAHADPLVLGAAVASRTTNLKIGFAVVELAFHHPVRLAVQTSLLDNLSHGRLIVGTGRGSAYNHYEYIGFGITMEDGLARLDEAEELLVKAWTGDPLQHEGAHWDVEFPLLRPRPYQQPHPPLIRACISEASTIRMAEIGRPVMIGIQTLENLQSRLERYRATMLDSGFTEEETEATVDQCWASRDLFVADSYDEAHEIAAAGFERERTHFRQARELYNPGGFPPPDPNRPIPAGESLEHSFIMGTPSQVAEQVAAMRDIGVRNLMLKLNVGEMDTHKVQKSMRMFGEKVMPHFA
ncbi:MAG: LLM class flavin-dependent oxidoreductase [Chloroflexota bacterium]|nr:LLM class flavin-dependent oxidoreductase [Chloroflexota bacterium]MDE2960072.1 LLM class flavin-dependent oxidoreductase [Chloroflexota bacterium]